VKGLQITRPGHFEIVDVPRPTIFPDEVVVEVEAINSCTHWDLTVWDGIDIFGREGHPKYPYAVGGPGHEWAGVVVEKGAQVTTVNLGDRVAYWGLPPGLRRLRTDNRALAQQARRPSLEGREEGEYGGYVQFVSAHERSVLPFPDGPNALSWREMAMLEMLSCVTLAVVRAGDLTGQRVAVSGMGAAGLMMLQALKTLGPDTLTAIDVQPDRCDLAVHLGADRAVNPRSKEWGDLREDEFTITVDCSGVPAAIEGDLEHTAGRLIVFSVPEADFRVPQAARRRVTTIEYARTPAGRPGKYARHLLTSGQVNVTPLLTHEVKIEEFDKGLDLLRSRQAIKVTFDMKGQ
jgi:threonine dehydrogenase-like Zn-dependent dehydrogenase